MSFFTTLMGEDVSTIRASVGARTNNSKARGSQVTYTPIDKNVMRTIYDFYVHKEPEITNANALKDGYSLATGLSFSFGNEELSPTDYPILEPVKALLSQARMWHDMFGFVAVYNPDAQLDSLLGRGDGAINYDDDVNNTSSTNVLDATEQLTRETRRLLKRIDPDNAARLAEKVAYSGAGTGSVAGQRARIINLPHTTSLHANDALLVVDNDSDSDDSVDSSGDGERVVDTGEAQHEKRIKSRTLERTLLDLANMRAVSIEDGQFYVETDHATMIRNVVFERNERHAGAPTQQGHTTTAAANAAIRIDPTVHVFVWDNRMPEANGVLNTQLVEVIRLRRAMDAAEANLAQVDYDLSHPLLIIEQEVPAHLTNIDTMTDSQVYGGHANSAAKPSEAQLMAQEMMANAVVAAQADMQNGRAQNQMQQYIAKHGMRLTQRDASGNAMSAASGTTPLNYFLMPPLLRIGAQGKEPKTIVDVGYARNRYRAALDDMLGVPQSLRDAGSSFSSRQGKSANSAGGSTQASATDASNAKSDQRLYLMVIQDRSALAQFFNKLYDADYRDIDNRTLAEVLARARTRTRITMESRLEKIINVEQELKDVTDIAAQEALRNDAAGHGAIITALNARLREIDRVVRAVLQMPYRLQVHFNSLAHVPPAELRAMVEQHMISALDYANAIRAARGMSSMTQAEYDANKQAALSAEAEQIEQTAEAQVKVDIKREKALARIAPAPTAGGGGSSSSSAPAAKKARKKE